MLTKINRTDCLSRYTVFPTNNYDSEQDEFVLYYPKVYEGFILNLPSKTFRGNSTTMGNATTRMTKELKAECLIFLGDSETAWLHQLNDYPPAMAAQQYLTNNKVGKRFNGALQVGLPELPEFIKHLCWLTRCNAALANIHFTDPGQQIIGSICKYGNLHLSILNKETDRLLKPFIDKSEFQYNHDERCFWQFGKSNAIQGRRIVV